jgi:hypothetical protein
MKLEELFLSRFKNSTREVCLRLTTSQEEIPFLDRISEKLPELVGFKALPASLNKLNIQGFNVKSEELMRIHESCPKLKVLELQLLGYRGPWCRIHSRLNEKRQRHGIIPDGEIVLLRELHERLPRDDSTYGSGVTPIVFKAIVTKLRKLETLFIEEFLNDRTTLTADNKLHQATQEASLLPGSGILHGHGYYGVLIDGKAPNFTLSRNNSRDSWNTRFNQYQFEKWIHEKSEEEFYESMRFT